MGPLVRVVLVQYVRGAAPQVRGSFRAVETIDLRVRQVHRLSRPRGSDHGLPRFYCPQIGCCVIAQVLEELIVEPIAHLSTPE